MAVRLQSSWPFTITFQLVKFISGLVKIKQKYFIKVGGLIPKHYRNTNLKKIHFGKYRFNQYAGGNSSGSSSIGSNRYRSSWGSIEKFSPSVPLPYSLYNFWHCRSTIEKMLSARNALISVRQLTIPYLHHRYQRTHSVRHCPKRTKNGEPITSVATCDKVERQNMFRNMCPETPSCGDKTFW